MSISQYSGRNLRNPIIGMGHAEVIAVGDLSSDVFTPCGVPISRLSKGIRLSDVYTLTDEGRGGNGCDTATKGMPGNDELVAWVRREPGLDGRCHSTRERIESILEAIVDLVPSLTESSLVREEERTLQLEQLVPVAVKSTKMKSRSTSRSLGVEVPLKEMMSSRAPSSRNKVACVSLPLSLK
jgi:hypothetical protein